MDQSCESGIHIVGQNKSNQIAIDLWGANFIQIHFFDAHDNPVAIGMLEVEEEFVEKFNWMEFENRLNNQFSRHLLNRKLSKVAIDNELNSFELLEYIRKKNTNLNREHRILKEISFELLFKTATHKEEISFSWKNFYQEYFRPLLSQFNFDYKVCYYSGEQVFLVIPESESDTFDFEVQGYNKKFPFWRFFDVPDQMVLSDLTPRAKSKPFSILGINKNYMSLSRKPLNEEKNKDKGIQNKTVQVRRALRNRPPMTM